MTPKEKAKELVWKYYHNIEHTISNEYADKDWEIAKQCALIAQENLLDKLASLNIKDEFEEAVLFVINAL
jgi:hypothetical protein